MRDRMLHDAMRQLTEDAAGLLACRLREGEEIPFEVGEAGTAADRRGTALIAYRPMTAEFVSSHADQLRMLPAFEVAANNLVRTRGMIAYLRVRGEAVLDVSELTHARLAALAFLSAVWNDAEHFEPWDARFDAAYLELESVALAERLVTSVFIPVYGVVLDCEPVNLGAGVELLAAEDLDAECVDRFSDAVTGADCYCTISVDAPSDAPAPMAAVRHQARDALTTLRMFKPGSVSLGLTAQANVGGAWQQASLPFSGRSREEAWRLLPGEDEELRQFMGAVRRVERRTRVSWALKRFEMGLERSVPAEGLSDFLSALRTLLEAHDDTGKAALPARVSALCARDSERVHVRESVEAAFALERLAVDGHVGRADRKRLAKRPPLEVIAEVERYLRALLHDLVCGYLATDLKKLADEILLADGEPPAPETAPQDPVYLEPVPAPGAATENATATREYDAVFDDTAEINVVDRRDHAGEQLTADPSIEPGEPDNVWTLRPAAEVKAAPELAPEPSYAGDGEPSAVSAEMHELAEDLVNRFENAFDETMEDDAPNAPAEPDAAARRVAEPSGDSADAGFTFDFKVLENPGTDAAPIVARRQDREQAPPPAADPDFANPDFANPDFPVTEFELPAGRGPATAGSDDDVDSGAQRASFNEIMDENFTPPVRDLSERPVTPLARGGRPHLVALDGAAAFPPPAPAEPEPSQETVEFDVLDELAVLDDPDGEPVPILEPAPELLATGAHDEIVVADLRQPTSEHRSLSSEEARTFGIGPATIEFRPIVDGDIDDPDDFAGAC